jgi:hypothetical protein
LYSGYYQGVLLSAIFGRAEGQGVIFSFYNGMIIVVLSGSVGDCC